MATHDELVSDTQVAKELGGVSKVCLWRWEQDPDLGFPKKIKINNRNYRRRSELEAFKQRRAEASEEELEAFKRSEEFQRFQESTRHKADR
jgi:predicted DNA-binding transcriptional regulator AlpA